MRMITRAAVVAVILLLAACGSTSSTGTATAPPSTAAPAGPARPDAAHIAAGVAAFKAAFPELAAGRADKAIGDDVDNTCVDVKQGERTVVVLRHVSARFERNGITPSAAQAEAILKAIQAAACPP